MKRLQSQGGVHILEMPPTRGHDLKRLHPFGCCHFDMMPPTRGHDLKPEKEWHGGGYPEDAPHTGARLETILVDINLIRTIDAPHTGARLETAVIRERPEQLSRMPPTRGHDLKLP